MNKIKEWIKMKLIKFLGIDDIDITLHSYIDRNNIYKKEMLNDIIDCKKSINILHETIENVVHIGTDVDANPNTSHNWAVICIEGKLNLVKFVSLNQKNIKEIVYFLKRYEAGRHCIDTPYQEIVYDELYKF